MTRLRHALWLALALLALAGCSHGDGTVRIVGQAVAASVVPLPDGRSVVCVVAGAGYGTGVTCDWENAQ